VCLVQTLVNIFGIEFDLLSFIPAVFGALLSVYNWLKSKKTADIYPNPIIQYGIISSSYHEGFLFCLPLIFHNEGSNKGMITEIRVGFRDKSASTSSNNKRSTHYLDIEGKVRLEELESNQAALMDWDNFQKGGYRILHPMYPIVVEPNQSADAIFIATAPHDYGLIAIGDTSECVIEVNFGKNRKRTCCFPFYIAPDIAERDNLLLWQSPNPVLPKQEPET